MLTELDILKDVVGKFDQLNVQYMLTGSLAMSYYAQPRMTRDIDLVVSITTSMIEKLEGAFSHEYYISTEAVKDAIKNEFVFNLIHSQSSIKIDCIIRKNNEYRITEFQRRRKIKLTDFEIYIVSKEDLVISKLIWFKESNSELQKRDIQNLLDTEFDKDYLMSWIEKLNLTENYMVVKND
jgi:hypothetical protein